MKQPNRCTNVESVSRRVGVEHLLPLSWGLKGLEIKSMQKAKDAFEAFQWWGGWTKGVMQHYLPLSHKNSYVARN